jgi:hypothetical protein
MKEIGSKLTTFRYNLPVRFFSWAALHLNVGPTGCPEISLTINQLA